MIGMRGMLNRFHHRAVPLLLCGLALAVAACTTTVPTARRTEQASTPPRVETRAPPPPPPATVAIQPAPSIPIAPGAVLKVGVVLPLSGPNEAAGQALREAMQLAESDLRQQRGTTRVEFIERDTGGTPDGAQRAAQEAIADGARIILGPLLGDEVQAVSPLALGAGVPVLSLSNNTAVAAPGVFVLGLLPSGQIEQVIRHARSKNLHRFAAFVPDNAYGRIAEDTLRNTLARNGGELVAVERYGGETADITAAARKLAEAERHASGISRQRTRDDPVGFDAIVIPDFGDRLIIAATMLPYSQIDIAKMQMIGTALWEDPQVMKEPPLGGGLFASSDPETRAAFVRRFEQSYGRPPPRIAALGYDAAALVMTLAQQGDISIAALTNPAGFAGYEGLFRLRRDGTNERAHTILQIQRGNAVVVVRAQERFADLTQ
jgi:ABC-type branched-subunit amino acid transport system substrate-binding protein